MTLQQLWSAFQKLMFEPRSPIPLCVFRIVYGLVLLEYCFLLAPEVITCFSDTNGILRIKTLSNIFGVPVINLLTALPPGDFWILAFFSVFVLACLGVTFGLFTKWSTILAYLGLVSLQHRNIYVVHSGDHLLALAAFYLMFAPADAALSLDRVRRIWFSSQIPPAIPEKKSMWAFTAYQFQFILIYWQTSWAKLASPSWWDGTAMYYVFRYEEFARFPVPFVPNNMFLLKMATWGALVVEFSAWLFIWFKETRYFVLLGLLALHLGIDYAMNIPVFEHIMIASLIIFIPADDLTHAMNWIKVKLAAYCGPPVILTYNGTNAFQRKLAMTVRSFDILGRVKIVDLQGKRDCLEEVPAETQDKVMVYACDSWLGGFDAATVISAKLPFFWVTHPVLRLLG